MRNNKTGNLIESLFKTGLEIFAMVWICWELDLKGQYEILKYQYLGNEHLKDVYFEIFHFTYCAQGPDRLA